MRLQTRLLHFFVLLLATIALPALADPPARVGRISFISGAVFFRADQNSEWTPATLNYPVTEHNQFATNADARLELRIGAAAVRLDEDSEISIPRLDDELIRVNLQRGLAAVAVHTGDSRYPVEIVTPDATVTFNGSGSYRVETGRDTDNSIVTVLRGSASLTTDEASFSVREGKEAILTSAPFTYKVRDAGPHPFDDWVAAREQRYERAPSARYVAPEITGYEDLDEYGNWQETPEYGAVWVPRVTVAGWAPYRQGHWAWVAPWGWTWVDAAPWGFAPYHYGRWVYFGNTWGWAPGPVHVRPVYAPALVAWVGQPGWSFSFSAGSGPAVGWFPLGWGEIYRPSYPCSVNYVRNVNITNVRIANIQNVNWSAPDPNNGNYSLRRFPQAVTVVPQQAFAGGKSVMRAAEPLRDGSPVARLPVATNAAPTVAPTRPVVANNAPQPTAPAMRIARPGQRMRVLQDAPPTAAKRVPTAPDARIAPAAPANGNDTLARGRAAPGTAPAVAVPAPPVVPTSPAAAAPSLLSVPVHPVNPDNPSRRFAHTPDGRTVIVAPGVRTQTGPGGAQPRPTEANPRTEALDGEGLAQPRSVVPHPGNPRVPAAEGETRVAPHPAAPAVVPHVEHRAAPSVQREQAAPPQAESPAPAAAAQRMRATQPEARGDGAAHVGAETGRIAR